MRGNTGQASRSVASDLGLHCLTMSYKKSARLIGVKRFYVWCICSVHTAENHVTLED